MTTVNMVTSFLIYCVAHPQERFWQALRNWYGVEYILIGSRTNDELATTDTFYLVNEEDRHGDH